MINWLNFLVVKLLLHTDETSKSKTGLLKMYHFDFQQIDVFGRLPCSLDAERISSVLALLLLHHFYYKDRVKSNTKINARVEPYV